MCRLRTRTLRPHLRPPGSRLPPFPPAFEDDPVEEGECPLVGLKYAVTIKGKTVKVDVAQEYVNSEDVPVEGLYQFPCDVKAVVGGVVIMVGGRRVRAEIMKTEDARDAYDDGVAQGSISALVERKAKTDDIYQISIGAMGPGVTASITLTYYTELNEANQFVIPLTTMPRYEEMSSRDTTSPPQLPPVTRRSQQPYKAVVEIVEKPDGAVVSHEGSHDLKIGEQNTFTPDKDVIIHVTGGAKSTSVTWSRDELISVDSFVNVASIPICPGFPSEESQEGLRKSPNTEIVILLDCSGSMSGEPIASCERVAKYFVQSLPVGCPFNILRFGSEYNTLFPSPTPLSEDSLNKAKAYVDGLKANLRGTKLLEPLTTLYKTTVKKDRSRQFLVITDGAVKNTHDVLKLVASKSTSTRVHSVGLGASCSKTLVDGLARLGNGTSTYIGNMENLTSQVMKIVKNMVQPAITSCSFRSTVPNFTVVGRSVPPIYYDTVHMAYATASSSWDPKKKFGCEEEEKRDLSEVEFTTLKNTYKIKHDVVSGVLTMLKGDASVGVIDITSPVLYTVGNSTVKFTLVGSSCSVTAKLSDPAILHVIGVFLNRYGVRHNLFSTKIVVGKHTVRLGTTSTNLEVNNKPVVSARYDAASHELTFDVEKPSKPLTVVVKDEALLPTLGDMADAAFIPHDLPSTCGAMINFTYHAEGVDRVLPCLGSVVTTCEPVHKIAAARWIKNLEDKEMMSASSASGTTATGGLKDKIIKMSLGCQVLSKYTAFVAVDEDGDQDAAQEAMVRRMVSLSEPRNVVTPSQGVAKGNTLRCAEKMKKKSDKNMKRSKRVAVSGRRERACRSSMVWCVDDDEDDMMLLDCCDSYGASSVTTARRPSPAMPLQQQQQQQQLFSTSLSRDVAIEEEDEKQQLSRPTPDPIIYLQTFAGSWDLTPKIAALLDLSLEAVKQEAASRGMPESVWITVLVLRHLEENFGGVKEEWELMEAKAIRYLEDAGYPDALKA